MKISYAITVVDEHVEIQRLIEFLLKCKKPSDKIIILFDASKKSLAVEEYLRSHSVNGEFIWYKGEFKRNFSDWKNELNALCSGDYIFNIDADEIPHENLITNIHAILELNPEIDAYYVPRVNTVEGITESHIAKWNWRVNEKKWINYPDPQLRIYKNKSEIRWVNKVHETLTGCKTTSQLPFEEEWSLYHPKDIQRQEKQNQFYNTI